MRILSLLIFCLSVLFLNRLQQSPHGAGFKISCKTCHSSKGWELDKSVYSFNHNTTKMPLLGQHTTIDCRQCHKTLVFSEARTNCIDCHNDIHQTTTGPDCSRCHNQVSWLVNNIIEIHQISRFPLIGAHRTADCSQCHVSESLLRFDVTGVNCIDCHRANFMATTNPNHIQSGMSQDCSSCHPVNAFQWAGAGFNHSVFPLVQGHSAVKCTDCHKTGSYTNTSADCKSCHQQDFLATKNPDHNASKFSTNCTDCHTLAPGWKPTTFNHTSFPHLHSGIQLLTAWIAIKVEIIPVHPQIVIPVIRPIFRQPQILTILLPDLQQPVRPVIQRPLAGNLQPLTIQCSRLLWVMLLRLVLIVTKQATILQHQLTVTHAISRIMRAVQIPIM